MGYFIWILFEQEDWVLCRVFYKNKADTKYTMDSEQDLITGSTTLKGRLCAFVA